jgi:prevent-host-death family protein
MRAWKIQEAKAHLSELVRETEHAGPQAITWHGREVAVVLSKAEYDRLSGAGQSLVEFICGSPLYDSADIEFVRDISPNRESVL